MASFGRQQRCYSVETTLCACWVENGYVYGIKKLIWKNPDNFFINYSKSFLIFGVSTRTWSYKPVTKIIQNKIFFDTLQGN